MKNKLKLGQAAGVVAFAIIIGAVSMSSSSTVDARTSLKENRTVNAGVALGLTEAAGCHRASHSRGYIGSYLLWS